MCGRFYLAIGTGVPSSLTLPVLHPPTLSTVFTWQVPWVLAVFLRVTDSKAIDIVQGIIIEWQELFPIVVACVIRHPVFTGKRPKFRCDTLISMKDNFLVWACRAYSSGKKVQHFALKIVHKAAQKCYHAGYSLIFRPTN